MSEAATAGVIGFIGVLAGAVLQRSSERRRWLRDIRMRVYAEFTDQAHLAEQATITLRQWLNTIDADGELAAPITEQALNAISEQAVPLWPLYYRIDLVGSPRVRAVADEIVAVADGHRLMQERPITRANFRWDQGVDITHLERFAQQARLDLGAETAFFRATRPPAT